MVKKTWFILGGIAIVVIIIVLVLMLVLVPQQSHNGVQLEEYTAIAKQEYSFSGVENKPLKSEYTITPEDVTHGKNTNKYEEGNINPFTPKKEVTIYNEPTKKTDKPIDGSNLTPSDK